MSSTSTVQHKITFFTEKKSSNLFQNSEKTITSTETNDTSAALISALI